MNKLKIGILIAIFIMLFTTVAFASSIEVPENIRVGLYYGSRAAHEITLSSPGGILVGVMNDGVFEEQDEIKPNKEIIITRGSKKGSVNVSGIGEIGSKAEYPYFKSIEDNGESCIEINGKMYRGNIEIRRFSDSDFTVINHLSMQEYLYGVVPREIGGNSPKEAVKAQAIVARTYATKNYGRRDKWGFDVYPTVDDQAYGGYSWENKNSNEAVDETEGQVVTYNGKLIGGYYFSTSGGYTEDVENVWGSPYGYLKAVPDYYEPEISGNTTWEVEYTAQEIEQKLAKHGINIGDIIDLKPIKYTYTGRVLELKVIGTNGEKILSRDSTRTCLGLKSQWYTINDDAPEVIEINEDDLPIKGGNSKEDNNWWQNEGNKNDDEDGECIIINPDYSNDENKVIEDEQKEIKPLLQSILDAIIGDEEEKINLEYEARNNKTTFVFRGRGWGHAVGMSQNGAKGMAKEGFNCEEIICWYYSGVEITK